MSLKDFLNPYAIIGILLIPIYLFPPIQDIIKKCRYKNYIHIFMSLLFVVALGYGYYSAVKIKIFISPDKFVAQPLYQQEFISHVTNNYSYPVYGYSVVIMVSEGDLNVNKDLKFESIESLGLSKSKFPIRAFGLGGTYGKYGLSYMELHFPEIDGNSTKKFLVQINGKKYSNRSTILFRIEGFSKKPIPTYEMLIKFNKDGSFPKKFPIPESYKKRDKK